MPTTAEDLIGLALCAAAVTFGALLFLVGVWLDPDRHLRHAHKES